MSKELGIKCPKCGYDLRAISQGPDVRCPECGEVSSLEQFQRPQSSKRFRWVPVMVLPGILAPLFLSDLIPDTFGLDAAVTLPVYALLSLLVSFAGALGFVRDKCGWKRGMSKNPIGPAFMLTVWLVWINLIISLISYFAMASMGWRWISWPC